MRTEAAPPTIVASGQLFPSPPPLPWSGSSCVTPVAPITSGSPSASVTPVMLTGAKEWFGGQTSGSAATAPLQTGPWFPLVIFEVHDLVPSGSPTGVTANTL